MREDHGYQSPAEFQPQPHFFLFYFFQHFIWHMCTCVEVRDQLEEVAFLLLHVSPRDEAQLGSPDNRSCLNH